MTAILRRKWVRVLAWCSTLALFAVCPLPGLFWLGAFGSVCLALLLTALAGALFANLACFLGETLDRSLSGSRFLCPHCLCFGPARFACGGCGKALESAVGRTEGLVASCCGPCGQALFLRRGKPGVGIRAQCAHCLETSPAMRHRWTPRVVGVLPQEWEAVAAAVERLPQATRYPNHCELLQGEDLTVLMPLDLAHRPGSSGPLFHGRPVPKHTVLRALRVLWLSGEVTDPLILARGLDALAVSLGQRQPLAVVAGREELDPALLRLLETKVASVRCGQSLGALVEERELDVPALPGAASLEPRLTRGEGPA